MWHSCIINELVFSCSQARASWWNRNVKIMPLSLRTMTGSMVLLEWSWGVETCWCLWPMLPPNPCWCLWDMLLPGAIYMWMVCVYSWGHVHVLGNNYHQRPCRYHVPLLKSMLMSMGQAAVWDLIGVYSPCCPRGHIDVFGLCYHWRLWWYSWPMLQ